MQQIPVVFLLLAGGVSFEVLAAPGERGQEGAVFYSPDREEDTVLLASSIETDSKASGGNNSLQKVLSAIHNVTESIISSSDTDGKSKPPWKT